MIVHVRTSALPMAAPCAAGAAVVWGPPVAGAVLADARRSDRAPPISLGIYVVSAITWSPLRLSSYAVCWGLEGLARSARLWSGRALGTFFTVVVLPAACSRPTLVATSGTAAARSPTSSVPISPCVHVPHPQRHPGPLGREVAATPTGRATLHPAVRLSSGRAPCTGAPPTSCAASSSRLTSFDFSVFHAATGRLSTSLPITAAAGPLLALRTRCIPPARAGVPRLPALHSIGLVRFAMRLLATSYGSGIARRRREEERRLAGVRGGGAVRGQEVAG